MWHCLAGGGWNRPPFIEMEKTVDYKRAAKTTILFSGVKVVTVVVSILRNKLAAVLLGPIGVGINNIYNTYLQFVQTGACLGLSQSAVRDISEAYELKDSRRFSRIISLTNRLVVLTSLLGILITVMMSPFFSRWGFGNGSYTISFILLSLSVGAHIYVENRIAVLKGMRQMRSLAYSTIIGSVAGLLICLPLYYFYREKGIVPVFILTAFISLLVTNYYVNKIQYERISLSFKEIKTEGNPMLKMGVALMMINFLSGIASTIIISFIRGNGGLEVVAYYSSGKAIISQYFGIVLTAMTTDYYPRICGVYKDNKRLKEEVNAQSKLGLIMTFPLALIFVAFASILIPLLFSDKFLAVSEFTDWALLGTLLSIPSNCIAMVLLAKQDAKVFTIISIVINVFNVCLFICFYYLYGLVGLGIAEAINVGVQWVVYGCIIGRRYKVSFSWDANLMLIIVLSIVIISVLVKGIGNEIVRYLLQSVFILFSCIYAFYWSKKMNLDLLEFVRNRLLRKK